MADSPVKALLVENRAPETANDRRRVVEWLLRPNEARVLDLFLEHVPVAIDLCATTGVSVPSAWTCW